MLEFERVVGTFAVEASNMMQLVLLLAVDKMAHSGVEVKISIMLLHLGSLVRKVDLEDITS